MPKPHNGVVDTFGQIPHRYFLCLRLLNMMFFNCSTGPSIYERIDCPDGKHRTGHEPRNAVGVLCGIIMLCASINEKDL